MLASLLLATALAGCSGLSGAPASGAAPPATITRTTEQGGRFISLVGPQTPHGEPFLGVAGTNVYALRSLIDTRTGETAHQLYVSDSYAGDERSWNAARDARGQTLRFISVSKNEITCVRGCSYAEEFAAALPEPLLRQSGGGLTVAFTAKSGAEKTIAVPGDLVQKQLAGVDEARAALPKVTAAVR